MRFLASLVLMGVVLEQGVDLQAVQEPSDSATVENVRLSGADGLEFVLRNRSDKAISAVSLSVSVTLNSGEMRSNHLAQDYLWSEPADIEGATSTGRARGRIPPGHGRTIRTARPLGVTAPQRPQPHRRTIKSFSQNALTAVATHRELAPQVVEYLGTMIRQKAELLSKHSVRRE